MGCDIHIHTEVKKTVNGVEKWVCADFFKKNPYFGDEGERELENVPVWRSRDYHLFAVLAGVRNYSDLKAISIPRGLPDNCTKEVVEDNNYWGSDGHTHSWLLLNELIDYEGEYAGIKHLTKLIIARAMEFWVYADDEKNQDKVRIVFWFDN